ncbi:DUF4359 domain-containing protein [Candidatus Nitrospira bockiana]
MHPASSNKKTSSIGVIAGLVALSGAFIVLGVSNPALPDYEAQVLTEAAKHRQSPSDAMLASVLQSISLPRGQEGPNTATPVSLLANRTKRANYVVFSVYTTEYDYCESSTRAVGRSLGIAGKFYTLEKGECPSQS